MPFDPISAAVAGGGMLLDFLKSQGAQQKANENQKFQVNNLIQAMSDARMGKASAGGLRLDQFGNATYYDPNQGRWITSFSPTQQRLIDEGQARQGRAQIRGSQASKDYDQLRAEYLYRQPKSEAQSYQEIIDLLNQAQGTGERQLDTLMNRFGIRTTGNLPQLVQRDSGPTAGQQLAETMLKARSSALDESLKRQAGHTSQYLPAMKQFEDTANYVAPVDPTGSGIIGLESEGRKSLSDYDKLLSTLAISGGRNVGSAGDAATKAAGTGPGASDFLNFAKMLMPTPDKGTKGTVGNTTGARYSGGSGDNSDGIGNWDRRYSFGPESARSGTGREAAAFGGERPEEFSGITGASYPSMASYSGVPNYGDLGGFGSGNAANFSGGYYQNPYDAWQF